jgi:hypothetical protein
MVSYERPAISGKMDKPKTRSLFKEESVAPAMGQKFLVTWMLISSLIACGC